MSEIDNLDLNVNFLSSDDFIHRNPKENIDYNSSYKSNRVNLKLAKKFTFGITDIQFLSEYNHDELINTSKIKNSASGPKNAESPIPLLFK